jgi:hypothetical protein
MSPVAVVDVAFWSANRMSNAAGDWPVLIETVAHGASLDRQLAVFNDTLAGTDVDVTWQMREDGPEGPVADQGTARVTVPLGQHVIQPITVKAPQAGARGYLILISAKGGAEIFREDGEWFTLQ